MLRNLPSLPLQATLQHVYMDFAVDHYRQQHEVAAALPYIACFCQLPYYFYHAAAT